MATISFTCPHCEKVLRSTQRPPAGRKVKCPACNEGFVPELDDEEAAASIQEKPKLKAKAKPVDDDDVDAEEVDVDEVDDDEDEAPKKKKRKRDDDDDDDEDRPKKKKKGKQKAGMNKMLIYGGIALVCMGGLFSCGILGVAAFVWPGFLLSGDSAMLAYVPPDANLVGQADMKQLRTRMEPLEKMLREQGLDDGQPGDKTAFNEVMKNAEKMVFFGNTKNMNSRSVMIAKLPQASIDRLKKTPGMGAAQTVGGHANVHRTAQDAKAQGLPAFVAFPGGDIVVFSDQNEAEFIQTMTRGKGSPAPNAAVELGKSAGSSMAWVAMSFDNDARKGMKDMFTKGGATSKKMQDAAGAVDGCKGAVISFDATGQQDLKIGATIVCKDSGDAVRIKDGAEDGFNQLRGFLALFMNAGGQMPGQPAPPKGFIQDLNSIAFRTSGSNATATLTITSQSIQELSQFAGAQKNRGKRR